MSIAASLISYSCPAPKEKRYIMEQFETLKSTLHSEELNHNLSADEVKKIDAYWRAANYLSVGQIYLLDNPLLKKKLSLQDIKKRLLGHWGTTPGLNFIYAHLNR